MSGINGSHLTWCKDLFFEEVLTRDKVVALGAPAAFFSYSREDSEFALRLAGDLKAAGANVWLDQLDIRPGDRWDHAVEGALTRFPCLLVILSPASVNSTNVMDEVSFALEEQKTVFPVMYRDCAVPFRLRRVQQVDFTRSLTRGVWTERIPQPDEVHEGVKISRQHEMLPFRARVTLLLALGNESVLTASVAVLRRGSSRIWPVLSRICLSSMTRSSVLFIKGKSHRTDVYTQRCSGCFLKA
jgi:hypothetical protein